MLSAGADEVPGVYKNILDVMREQHDLVDVVAPVRSEDRQDVRRRQPGGRLTARAVAINCAIFYVSPPLEVDSRASAGSANVRIRFDACATSCGRGRCLPGC